MQKQREQRWGVLVHAVLKPNPPRLQYLLAQVPALAVIGGTLACGIVLDIEQVRNCGLRAAELTCSRLVAQSCTAAPAAPPRYRLLRRPACVGVLQCRGVGAVFGFLWLFTKLAEFDWKRCVWCWAQPCMIFVVPSSLSTTTEVLHAAPALQGGVGLGGAGVWMRAVGVGLRRARVAAHVWAGRRMSGGGVAAGVL